MTDPGSPTDEDLRHAGIKSASGSQVQSEATAAAPPANARSGPVTEPSFKTAAFWLPAWRDGDAGPAYLAFKLLIFKENPNWTAFAHIVIWSRAA